MRAAALDALTDSGDPAALQALVVRLHDSSLHRGRRLGALTAFGPDIERFLLELAHVDPANRLNYARALRLCGSDRARPALSEWLHDASAEVRAASFEALARVGLDDQSAALAIDGLNSKEATVRAMAAHALHGWTSSDRAAARVAEHLDDVWIVAVRAARSLQSMGPHGLAKLQEHASRPDLAGVLHGKCCGKRRPYADTGSTASGSRPRPAHGSVFVAWSVAQIAMGVCAATYVRLHQLRNTRRSRALVTRLASPPLVSIVAPAYNEQLTIEESVRAMLALDYESSEIVVVNDGSTDETLSVLTAAFRLVPAPVAFAQPLTTAPVRGIYRSITEPALVVIDKENGRCKADAVNAGINAASGSLVLIIDADTILERDALEPRGVAVPRGSGDGGRRRHHRHCQRVPDTRRTDGGHLAAAKLAGAISDHRVHAWISSLPPRLRIAQCGRTSSPGHSGCSAGTS